MKIKDNKCSKCGQDNFFFADKGNQVGIYCSYCGKWLKWADKDEQNLRMKQEPILDKIRAEIEHKANSCNIIMGEDEDTYEWGKHNAYAYALFIIDKYMAESEG